MDQSKSPGLIRWLSLAWNDIDEQAMKIDVIRPEEDRGWVNNPLYSYFLYISLFP
jgi:hypothetical protein